MTNGDDVERAQVVDLYKLAVEMADRISARRATANGFFLTVQTTMITVIGLTTGHFPGRSGWRIAAIVGTGVGISACWWLLLRSYRDLNRAKFNVITEIERTLPVKVFTDEWATLKTDPIGGWVDRYAELGTIERVIPWLFAILYVVMVVGA